MADVESGEILVADHDGVYIIKMSGDVRLNLCVAFDDCIESLFDRNGFESVLFDFSEADNMDSTTLGLVAKLAVWYQKVKKGKPIAYCTNPGVRRLLQTMGLQELCEVVDTLPDFSTSSPEYQRLKASSEEDKVKAKVLESHHVLMELNETNRQTFKDLVETLKGYSP